MITIYHNPRCSKSRASLELLKENGITPNVVLYLESPPSESTLSEIIKKLDVEPTAIIRFKESQAVDLGLSSADERSDDEWYSLILKHPILLERPIVVSSDKAAIGRPPENILNLLS